MSQIATADELVAFVKQFTGSTNDAEIKECIFMGEMMMRNLELPIQRSDPYSTDFISVAGPGGLVPIPGDMLKPIIFFKMGGVQGSTNNNNLGPWIVYDRIGDRDIITQSMIAQLYLQPVNVPAVIRGKFSEVYNKYQFLPYIAEGDLINMYYYKAWPLLFAPVTDEVISATGSISTITGTGPWTFTVAGMTTVGDLTVGDEIYATDGVGSFGTGGVTRVTSIISPTSITATTTGGTGPDGGTVTGITQTGLTVQNNAVLQTWPEGYVYATLREYYIKRHNDTDAAVYQQKFDAAMNTVEDQNNLGKWSGGHTRLTSVWQPRQYRQYNIK